MAPFKNLSERILGLRKSLIAISRAMTELFQMVLCYSTLTNYLVRYSQTKISLESLGGF